MKCKLVVNRDSGNCEKLNTNALLRKFGCNTTETIDANSDWNADGFDTVIVCGGDGTLFNALAKCRGKKTFLLPVRHVERNGAHRKKKFVRCAK